MGVKIDHLGRADVERVVAAGRLFDGPAPAAGATRFLTSAGHHLLVASIEGEDVGFVTGVETTHPDKGTEMFLYELGVDRSARGQGVGTALVAIAAFVTSPGGPSVPGVPCWPAGMLKARCTSVPSKLTLTVAGLPGESVVTESTITLAKGGPCGPSGPGPPTCPV